MPDSCGLILLGISQWHVKHHIIYCFVFFFLTQKRCRNCKIPSKILLCESKAKSAKTLEGHHPRRQTMSLMHRGSFTLLVVLCLTHMMWFCLRFFTSDAAGVAKHHGGSSVLDVVNAKLLPDSHRLNPEWVLLSHSPVANEIRKLTTCWIFFFKSKLIWFILMPGSKSPIEACQLTRVDKD